MFPIIFKFGPLTVYSYGLMLAIAVVVCSYLLSRDAQQALGIKPELIYDFVFWTVLGGIAGARIFFVFLNFEIFATDPLEIIRLQNGGLCWQGGLILGTIVGIYFVQKNKWPVWKMADLVAPYLALGQSIGRIGCFLNGCCYGKPVSWGIYFPAHDEHLHPTQLYESVGLLLLFFVLKNFQKSTKFDGQVFLLYLLSAVTLRFFNEFFRADHDNIFFGLSIFQLVCISIFIGASYVYTHLNRRS